MYTIDYIFLLFKLVKILSYLLNHFLEKCSLNSKNISWKEKYTWYSCLLCNREIIPEEVYEEHQRIQNIQKNVRPFLWMPNSQPSIKEGKVNSGTIPITIRLIRPNASTKYEHSFRLNLTSVAQCSNWEMPKRRSDSSYLELR